MERLEYSPEDHILALLAGPKTMPGEHGGISLEGESTLRSGENVYTRLHRAEKEGLLHVQLAWNNQETGARERTYHFTVLPDGTVTGHYIGSNWETHAQTHPPQFTLQDVLEGFETFTE